ncbi:hypothetical protein ACQ4PT_011926 [Festuca glaucescens]
MGTTPLTRTRVAPTSRQPHADTTHDTASAKPRGPTLPDALSLPEQATTTNKASRQFALLLAPLQQRKETQRGRRTDAPPPPSPSPLAAAAALRVPHAAPPMAKDKGNTPDLLDWVGPDISAAIFRLLHHPAHLLRASAAQRSWRRFVVENDFCRKLCERLCPEAATLAAAVEVSRSAPAAAVVPRVQRRRRGQGGRGGVPDLRPPLRRARLQRRRALHRLHPALRRRLHHRQLPRRDHREHPRAARPHQPPPLLLVQRRPRTTAPCPRHSHTGSAPTSASSTRSSYSRSKHTFRLANLYTLQGWCDSGWATANFLVDLSHLSQRRMRIRQLLLMKTICGLTPRPSSLCCRKIHYNRLNCHAQSFALVV